MKPFKLKMAMFSIQYWTVDKSFIKKYVWLTFLPSQDLKTPSEIDIWLTYTSIAYRIIILRAKIYRYPFSKTS